MSSDYEFIVLSPDLDSWNADYSELDKLDISPEDTAFLVVHNVGGIVNVPKLKKKYKGYVFLEDNCEGFTGMYEDQYSGTASMASSMSFFGNKTITSGEGGALATNEEDVFELLNSVKNQGASSKRYVYDRLGYNYRFTNLAAAILQGQLEDLDMVKYLKSEIFSNYAKGLDGVDEVRLQENEEETRHSEWMFAIKLLKSDRVKLANFLFENGFESRPMFPPINYHKQYSEMPSCEKAEELYSQCIMLPSFPGLNKSQVKKICELIKEYYK
jgi:perosamine synthetase